MESHKLVSMEDLKVGDVVMTVEDDELVATIVIGFLDRRVTENLMYLKVSIGNGTQLKMSKTHVIFVINNEGQIISKLGKDLRVGEHVTSVHNSLLQTSQIVGITSSSHVGVYVPLTDRGTILVDGVLVSCYTNVDHSLAHLAFAPARWANSYFGRKIVVIMIRTYESQIST